MHVCFALSTCVCSEGLLSRPMTADAVTQLHIDEHRTKSVLRQSGMHNNSSLTGPGAVVGGEVSSKHSSISW